MRQIRNDCGQVWVEFKPGFWARDGVVDRMERWQKEKAPENVPSASPPPTIVSNPPRQLAWWEKFFQFFRK
jgi:hypothetical protein